MSFIISRTFKGKDRSVPDTRPSTCSPDEWATMHKARYGIPVTEKSFALGLEEQATPELKAAGATEPARPTETPWSSLNSASGGLPQA
jgi:hypothetical protein